MKEELGQALGQYLGAFIEELKDSGKNKGQIALDTFEDIVASLGIPLGPVEKSYCVYIMYSKHKDLDKLEYGNLIEMLKSMVGDEDDYKEDFDQNMEREEMRGSGTLKGEADIDSNKNEYQENFEPEVEDNVESHPESEHRKSSQPQENEHQYVDLTEDQMIEIAQNCFQAIAQYMQTQGLNLRSIFADQITRETIEEETAEVISTDDFLATIQKMAIEGLGELEQACLIKVLSVNDDGKWIKISDLIQILEDYGIKESSAPGESPREPEGGLDFAELDKVSMVLMLALTEYLIKANIPLYDLFDSYVYNQPVAFPDGSQKSLEVIDSPNFFKVMHEIGIKTDDNEHENLQSFLALAPENTDKISVDRLKEGIEAFATDEKLRGEAHQCYMELIEGADEEEEEGKTMQQFTIYYFH
eukprot:TRINITY_DN977_c0_g1_i1.p4 TRINITY_DN977_c0_g1~~TRINITY_DN977_c0_g1_i1.p4  ORF type:complete len:416 (-),score=80.46 TRINITY_DN977_c0_g1_i1:5871-7118(-)